MMDFRIYPPAGEKERIDAYLRYEKLFLGKHRELYAPAMAIPQRYQMKRYIVANFAGVISRLCADLLFGEQPDFTRPTNDAEADAEGDNAAQMASDSQVLAAMPEAARAEALAQRRADREHLAAARRRRPVGDPGQDALDRLVESNNLHTTNYESALSNSFRGDAVYKVRWGLRTAKSTDPESIIEEFPASIYFPEVDEDDIRHIIRATLAWEKKDPVDRNKRYLRVEEHEPGIIRNRLLIRSASGAAEEVPLNTLAAYAELKAEVETGLQVIPVFHIPNFVYGSRFWGISDYEGLESLFETLNDRMSQIDAVLTKHVMPKMIVPPGFVDEDGKIRFDKMEVMTIESGEQPPSYITWDAHLAAAYMQIDKLLELLFLCSETAPSAFGLDKFGIAESGRALRLRLLRTLAKINRKRLYYDRALKDALLCAQQLEVIHGGATYEPVAPVINWADGLPEDLVEMVEMESQRLAAGNTSVESSIRRLDGPDAVEAEMERIDEEGGQAVAITGAAGNRGQPALPFQPGNDAGQNADQGRTPPQGGREGQA